MSITKKLSSILFSFLLVAGIAGAGEDSSKSETPSADQSTAAQTTDQSNVPADATSDQTADESAPIADSSDDLKADESSHSENQ